MLEKTTTGSLGSVVGSAANILGGGPVTIVAKGIGALLGGNNTDPVARALADSFKTGDLVRLGAAPKSLLLPPATDAAPIEGLFYLHVGTGTIYQSKAAGFYAVSDSWATERSLIWYQARQAGVIPATNPETQKKLAAWILDRTNNTGRNEHLLASSGMIGIVLAIGLISVLFLRK